ncbi:hypothetical protein EMIHUDRAFT_196787 [Emiliania huxleyi CCMP1516]|uniref:Kinesin motor domain-containing protein n=2 Tax=Emiliania huxleyi TaxID=2903 RepID=A0A0D3J4Q2_EMIH1|nr:hypothetical protein EMIHUDRAFT_196787 [Emiliania huxleyi CCMP1516]EOD18487.1 hypothetical protein EMIHUDRAFT_196787 [Emiliania huxleyi CCMP1516]|eukprot:XP_005770916.1 hypothetical protein EMIHUDRAFT_196787 [Emiliania huxleyi CCMP1516]
MRPSRGAKPKITRPRVYARLRPMHGRDAGKPELFQIDETSLSYVKEEGGDPCRYVFDQVFGMDAQQEQVYEAIGATAIEQMRQGFNSTPSRHYGMTARRVMWKRGSREDRRGEAAGRASRAAVGAFFGLRFSSGISLLETPAIQSYDIATCNA